MRAASLAVQRRQLTVLFCDLVGSTKLSTQLDPEDLLDVTKTCLRFFAQCIEGAGGFVARYAGDGVLAYFGYPEAHEDDAARAISSALLIREGLQKLPTSLNQPLAVRIGIATGVVVVGDLIGSGSSEERSVVGETPNMAARLQSVAESNAVVISDATRRLAAGLFRFRAIGPLTLKGLSPDMEAWEVIEPHETVDRFGAHQWIVPGPLIGRQFELNRILDLWHRRTGGQLVGLIGEPGIGKSRLLYEVRRAISRKAHVWLEGGGAQVFKNTPFHAVSQIIRSRLARGRSISDSECLTRLGASLRQAGIETDHALTLIADLIGIATPDLHGPLTMNLDQRRRRLMSILMEWLLRSAAKWPVVMAIEDIQWIDPSTIEFLTQLIERMERTPLLLIYTMREDASAHWPAFSRHERIRLGRLNKNECRYIVDGVTNHNLPDATADTIAARADGVPLFAEELARLVAEPGSGASSSIPSTLSDLFLARLEQLGPAKHLAHIASVLGGEFRLPLLRAVSRLNEMDLRSALAVLAAADIVVRRGENEDETYVFKHSLIRDAAYDILLKSQRRSIHRDAATIITERFPGLAVAQPEVLAQHWSAAGDFGLAIDAWQEAGRSAAFRRAYAEAQRAYENAISLIGELARSPRRDQRELELQSAYAGVLQITLGYSAPATGHATNVARQLASKGGDLRKQCAHIAGAWMAASSSGDYAMAARLADQLLPFALAEGSLDGLGIAYMIRMTTCCRTGDLMAAEEAFSAGRPYFGSSEFLRRPGAAAQTFGNAAINAWILDDVAQARRRSSSCLEICGATGNPYDLAFAQHMAAMQAILLREYGDARGLAQESMQISDRNDYPQFAAISRIVLGRAEAALGLSGQGLARIREGVERMAANQSRNGITIYLTWLAEAMLESGDVDEAFETLTEALRVNPQERFFRPEALRLRAEIQSSRGEFENATADCREAVALAKSMGAKLFHARAVSVLKRLKSA